MNDVIFVLDHPNNLVVISCCYHSFSCTQTHSETKTNIKWHSTAINSCVCQCWNWNIPFCPTNLHLMKTTRTQTHTSVYAYIKMHIKTINSVKSIFFLWQNVHKCKCKTTTNEMSAMYAIFMCENFLIFIFMRSFAFRPDFSSLLLLLLVVFCLVFCRIKVRFCAVSCHSKMPKHDSPSTVYFIVVRRRRWVLCLFIIKQNNFHFVLFLSRRFLIFCSLHFNANLQF